MHKTQLHSKPHTLHEGNLLWALLVPLHPSLQRVLWHPKTQLYLHFRQMLFARQLDAITSFQHLSCQNSHV